MSNAIEFISSYNIIDAKMRSIYRGKGNLQFSDLVRRLAEINRTVHRYEEELISFAKLRNAIVHNSVKEHIIAEPSEDVTALIAHIADLLSAPPKLSVLKEQSIMGIDEKSTLKEAIVQASKTGYSNLPVYRGQRLMGILNNRRIVRALGNAFQKNTDVENVLSTPCIKFLQEEDMMKYYKLLSPNSTVEEAVIAFEQNRKLLAVVVTEHGVMGERVRNLITSADLPQLYRLLED